MLEQVQKSILEQVQRSIGRAVQAGARLEAIEREIIECAPLDEEEKSALWLYAEAVTDRPARLRLVDKEAVWLGRC